MTPCRKPCRSLPAASAMTSTHWATAGVQLSSQPMAAPLLTLALLVASFVAGWFLSPPRRPAAVILVAWAVLMPLLFVENGVGDDGDIGAFVFAAAVVLGLALALAWVGRRLASRRAH